MVSAFRIKKPFVLIQGLILNTVGYNDDIISELSQNTPIVLSNRRINSASFNGDFVDSTLPE